MKTPRERILVVESDPEISDLIARQTLQPMGYQVDVVGAAGLAIQEAMKSAPDAIIANLDLPGLSGKDLLVALSSQGLEVPIIVVAEKGKEGDIIQAFRLGAADLLSLPLREAEVLSAVERVLRQGQARREREELSRQLRHTNQELQRRVRELTTIFAIGKAVTSITNMRALLDQVLEGAVYVTEADMGWLLLKEEKGKNFILSACKNMPESITKKMNQPWEDGLSSLVALSGESLSIYGEPLKRFKVALLGKSALVAPLKAKKEVIGMLVVVRKEAKPFAPNNQALAEAVADYASISLLNARLFKALEDRAKSLQSAADLFRLSENITKDMLRALALESGEPLVASISAVEKLASDSRIAPDQLQTLRGSYPRLKYVEGLLASLATTERTEDPTLRARADLCEVSRRAVARFQKTAQQRGVALLLELPSVPVIAYISESQIIRALEGLLSNAIKFSKAGGAASIRLSVTGEKEQSYAILQVKDSGIGMEPQVAGHIFDRKSRPTTRVSGGGIGIGLVLIREIVTAHGGKLLVESQPGKGSEFCISLPLPLEN
jgi:signal transduction histidine kinase/DNA-binding response OmpR family regulator